MPLTEAQWQRQITDYATLNNWRWYHTRDSRGSNAGWPDLALWRPETKQFMLVEVKTWHGRCSKTQDDVMIGLRFCGVDVRVWRPCDWPEVQETLRR